jgi:serine/threonine protein kinase
MAAGKTLGALKLSRVIGSGTYGTVWEAQDENRQVVAVKETRFGAGAEEAAPGHVPKSFGRERAALMELKGHENVVRVLDTLKTERSVALVLEYVDSDLQTLLRGFRQRGVKPARREVACIMRQLLEAVAYMHALGWAHRDIKCANVLVSAGNVVKLADFGMARRREAAAAPGGGEAARMTAVVVTLWYRAPELLAPGGTTYDARAVDMWSVGCILAEMMLGEPLYPGQNELHQVRLIKELSRAALHARIMNKHDSEGARAVADLACRLLEHDPVRRLSAAQALEHDFFKLDEYPVEPHELEVRAFPPPVSAAPAAKPPTTRPPPLVL